MNRWPSAYQKLAIAQFRHLTHAEIARIIGKDKRQVAAFLENRGYKKIPNWTEMEILIIKNGSTKFAHELLPHRSRNAIRIKKHRLCTHAK